MNADIAAEQCPPAAAEVPPTPPAAPEVKNDKAPRIEAPVEVTAENLEKVIEQAGCKPIYWPNVEHKPSFTAEFVEPSTSLEGGSNFPFDEVYRHLDGAEPDESIIEHRQDLIEMLQILMRWIKGDSRVRNDERAIGIIGIRAIAAIWVINPAIFDNVSGNALARAYGISVFNFSRITSEFSRQFKLRNYFQVHDGKNKPARRSAKLNFKNEP